QRSILETLRKRLDEGEGVVSIYPVRLSEWFPEKYDPKKKWADRKEQKSRYEICKMIVDMSACCVCGKKPQYRWAWGMHAIPWGYGSDEIWCSKKCLNALKKRS